MNELTIFEETSLQVRKRFEKLAGDLRTQISGREPKAALDVIDSAIDVGLSFTQGSMLYTIHAIALARDQWDQLDVSDQELFAPTFYEYVSRKFQTRQSSSTVDNYVNVARTWLVENPRVEVPNEVILFDMDDDEPGSVVNESGDAVHVEPEIWNTQYSKLLVANARAAKGKMEEEDWGLLFNPKVSQGKLLDYWRGSKSVKKTSTLSFQMKGDWLCVSDGEEQVSLAEVDFYSINNDPLAQQGWARLRAILGIEGDDF